MKPKILIPAHKEAAYIGSLLHALPSQTCEPIVLANGCEDETAGIASAYGATVFETEQPGKMPAVQDALRRLGRNALERPILMTDADSVPVMPRQWPDRLTRLALREAQRSEVGASVVAGPVLASGGVSQISNVLRSGKRFVRQLAFMTYDPSQVIWCGANMAMQLGTEDQLEAILGLPHYWPGEDLAMADTLSAMGARATQSVMPQSAVLQSARYYPPIWDFRRAVPKAQRSQAVLTSYTDRAAKGSIPYVRGEPIPAQAHAIEDLAQTG